MSAAELGSIAKRVRERTGRTIRDWAGEHRVGTTVVSEFERLGKIPSTRRIRRALEHAYGFPQDSLDQIADGADVEETLAAKGTLDDRLPQLVAQLRDLVDELGRAIGGR